MNPAVFAVKKRTIMFVLMTVLVAAGLFAYQKLGRLEYPNFTIKTALVKTPYPGAGPEEVEEKVTDRIEEAIQSMGQVRRTYSTSQESLSIVYVEIKEQFKTRDLPQIWDELRRKIGDMQGRLPSGAGPSVVNDDFGDVYGLFFALTGEGYTYAQLKDYAEFLKNEFLLCEGVAKVSFWGTQQEVLYVEFKRARLAELGISPERVRLTLESQNFVQQSGKVDVGEKYVRVAPTGDFVSEEALADLRLGGRDGLVRLGDVATISMGYEEPPRNMLRFNGKSAIGLGISVVAGGNVVSVGRTIKERLVALEPTLPLGMELTPIYYQSDIVTESVNQFVVNLIESVGVVIGLLMLFMGIQSGVLIGVLLVLTILATFVGMYLLDIELQKVSLGALVLALGMLVDNAIVVADGILVRLEKGEEREKAACEVVRETQWPLLGATVVAILAFGAIGFAPGRVSEFCRSLFQVMALSLMLSWILAVTVMPLLCVKYLSVPKNMDEADPYAKTMFRVYRRTVHLCLSHRIVTMAAVSLLLVLAIVGFGKIPLSFFPHTTQPFFYVNFRRPQGTHLEHTSRDMAKLECFVGALKGVRNVSAFVGEGALRFILSYGYENANSSYGQLLVEVEDYREIGDLLFRIEAYMRETFPDAEAHCMRIMSGPFKEYTLEVRFRGPDVKELKALATRTEAIMKAHPNVRDVRTDWRQSLLVPRPVFAEDRARRTGSTRQDLAGSLQWNFGGRRMGTFREGTELIPIISRPVEEERKGVENMENVQVWSSLAGVHVPLQQVISSIDLMWEDPLIQRRNRQKTITVQANPLVGLAEPLRRRIREAIEAVPLPLGYTMEWGGEYAESKEARDPLKKSFPLCLGSMFVILVCLFDSIRRSCIIFLLLPLIVMGVTAGLLLTGQPFGFMAILGFLGLSGMLIKNAIVLIDQIELDLAGGKPPYKALLDASVSRMRPVIMAAGTTILGMAPLVTDPLYAAMAVTIMGGLFGGTFLTLIVVPVLYGIFFRIRADGRYL